jgi:hypothetical protein
MAAKTDFTDARFSIANFKILLPRHFKHSQHSEATMAGMIGKIEKVK